jgi:hypothetical protein
MKPDEEDRERWPVYICDREFNDKKEIYDYVQTLKNYDYVEHCGGERWKDGRSFKDFKLTYEDLHIKKSHFNALTGTLDEEVWPFCDTVFLCDIAEDDEHVLDWCFHGERMGWKVGDEYWLVQNWARNRLELRKADPEKWTPLDKFIINDDLELRFKLGYIGYDEDDDENEVERYVQEIGVNSFPDRIEIHFNSLTDKENPDFTDVSQIFDYYVKKNGSEEVTKLLYPGFNAHFYDTRNALKRLSQLDGLRRYNLYDEGEHEDMQKVYDDVLRYSHQLKFYQEMDKGLSLKELNDKTEEENNENTEDENR